MSGTEEVSRQIYHQLDSTGYRSKMIDIRRKVYRSISKICKAEGTMKLIYSGSKGEGISKDLESDDDVLYFVKATICLDDPALEHLIPAHITVFTILDTKPGYCMLELLRQGTIQNVDIEKCLVPYNEKVMLSSRVLSQEKFNALTGSGETVTLTGPALTFTFPSGGSMDHVTTFSCAAQSILKDWVNRPRTNDWPPSSLRQSVLQMTGNLVATGSDDSEIKHLEWRYCFNEIEMRIGETLNDTQLKLYKMLKIINNDIFKQRGLSLTSFIMKNIVFWLAETHPQSEFLPETLFHWICESLLLLKQYAKTNNMPYYMIPGRNLLKEKVNESDRPKLIKVIAIVSELSPVLLLYLCKTLRIYAELKPSELSIVEQKFEVHELCEHYAFYYRILLTCQKRDPNQDILYMLLRYRQWQIFRAGWPPQIQEKINSSRVVNDYELNEALMRVLLLWLVVLVMLVLMLILILLILYEIFFNETTSSSSTTSFTCEAYSWGKQIVSE